MMKFKNKRYFGIFKEGSKINQILCAILINLPVFAYGASIGWMSPMTLLLQSKDSPTGEPLSSLDISWMASIGYLTCVAADYLMAFMGDKFGRKFSLMFISASLSVSWILMLSLHNVYVMIFARALVGVIMGGSFVTCPVYTKEISDDNIRGALGCLGTLFQTSGNLFLYIIGDVLSYNTILWVCLAMPVFHLVVFLMMPESPSYLVKKGKLEKAQRVLAWLKCREEGDPVILNELERIKKELLKDENCSKFMLKTIVTDKILFRAFCIAMVVTVGREICGAITIQNYAGEIFAHASKSSDLILTPNQQAMVLGSVQVTGAALGSGVIEKTGRKILLILTAVFSGLSTCALASWFLSISFGADPPTWIPILTLCVCIFCDSMGLQPISVVLVGETFSYKYRATMLAITMSIASVLGFLQLVLFKTVSDTIGVYAVFYFFGAVSFSVALYVILAVPETKNRPLEEIHSDLRTKKEKAKDIENEIKAAEEVSVLYGTLFFLHFTDMFILGIYVYADDIKD